MKTKAKRKIVSNTPASGGGREVQIGLPGRTFSRTRGCYNCRNYDNGSKARALYDVRKGATVQTFLERGETLERAGEKMARLDVLFRPPMTGVCVAGKSDAEFVQPVYLCPSWTGRVRIEGKMETLADELKNKLGDRTVPKVGR